MPELTDPTYKPPSPQAGDGPQPQPPIETGGLNQYTDTVPLEGEAKHKPQEIAFDPSMSVEGRVANMLSDPNKSPLLKAAQTRNQQLFNKSGRLNSALSDSGSVAAMIDAAVPIATSDATTNYDLVRANQDAVNLANTQRLQGAIDRNNVRVDAEMAAGLDNTATENKGALVNTEYGNKFTLEGLQQEGSDKGIKSELFAKWAVSKIGNEDARNNEIRTVQQTAGLSAEEKTTAIQSINDKYDKTSADIDAIFANANGVQIDFSYLTDEDTGAAPPTPPATPPPAQPPAPAPAPAPPPPPVAQPPTSQPQSFDAWLRRNNPMAARNLDRGNMSAEEETRLRSQWRASQ